ncbi:MAG: L-lactate permease [Clostridium sp.]|nr:L-lactate permease [Clostridium sp.]
MEYLVSALPIVVLFLLMLGLKVSGWKSAVITFLLTLLVSFGGLRSGLLTPLIPGAPAAGTILWASVEGVLKGVFPIFLIILTAIFSYNILIESRQIEVIKRQFISLTTDKGILVLLMVWGFGGLLEGMAGFGTAVAIPAAILIGLGFRPFFSAFVALLGNTVATGFAAVGVPVIILCKEAAPAGAASAAMISQVSTDTVVQLSLMFFFIPFAILTLTYRRPVVKNMLLSLWVGGVSFVVQFACAFYMGAETPAILGSIAAIVAMVAAARVMKTSGPRSGVTPLQSLRAWSVYIAILALILLTGTLCPPVNGFLKTRCVSSFDLPVISTTFRFGWISNAALMILAGSVAGGLIQGLSLRRQALLLCRTLVSLRFTALTILSLIAMASVMNYTGMIATMASGLVALTGSFYPLFAPLIGAVGTFVTGSDTSSNILFAKLQVSVAGKLGLTGGDANWLLAANTTGATGGKMLSPQSIAVATAACDLKGSDAAIMRATIPYALVYVLAGGLVVYFGL